ncbi:MAG: metalloregulator ArsR/SmtB family transcription factor [Thermoleophilia bacterium]
MARQATTADVFNAVADARRRDILDALRQGGRSVGDLVGALGLAQPQVSKHLGVLRAVGAVSLDRRGRHHVYTVNGDALRPIHDWVGAYHETWTRRLDALDAVLREEER